MSVRTRYGEDLSKQDQAFWLDLLSLEAFVGVVISPVKHANTAEEFLRLVHFIYWVAPPPNTAFAEAVRFLRNEVALIVRAKRRALQKTGRAKIASLNRLQVRAILYGKVEQTPQRSDFYKSWEWRTLRMQALKERGARCGCCGATPKHHDVQGNPIRLVVDHIKPLATHWHLRLDLENLQILCDECNQGKGAWDSTDWSR